MYTHTHAQTHMRQGAPHELDVALGHVANEEAFAPVPELERACEAARHHEPA